MTRRRRSRAGNRGHQRTASYSRWERGTPRGSETRSQTTAGRSTCAATARPPACASPCGSGCWSARSTRSPRRAETRAARDSQSRRPRPGVGRTRASTARCRGARSTARRRRCRAHAEGSSRRGCRARPSACPPGRAHRRPAPSTATRSGTGSRTHYRAAAGPRDKLPSEASRRTSRSKCRESSGRRRTRTEARGDSTPRSPGWRGSDPRGSLGCTAWSCTCQRT